MSATVGLCRVIYRLTITITFVFICYVAYVSSSGLSDLRLCGDKHCTEVISIARAIVRHKQMDPIYLYFERGDDIEILSKSAGKNQELWGGQVRGKKGYFPRSFVREYKVDIPNPGHLVPTEEYTTIEEKLLEQNRPQNTATVEDETEIADEDIDSDLKQEEKKTDDIRIKSDDKTEVDDTELDDEDDDKDADAELEKDMADFDINFDKDLEDETELADGSEEKNKEVVKNVDGSKTDPNQTPDAAQTSGEQTENKEGIDFDAMRKTNILKHLDRLDENLVPFFDKKEDEKAKIAELNKLLQNANMIDEHKKPEDTQEIKQEHTEKKDTEVKEAGEEKAPVEDVLKKPADNQQKQETVSKDDETEVKEDETEVKDDKTEVKEVKTEVKEDKTEVKEDKTEVKEDGTQLKEGETKVTEDETEIIEDETEVKSDAGEMKKDETEVDETEVKEENDKKPESLPIVQNTQNADKPVTDNREIGSKESERMKDILQVQVDDAIRQAETGNKDTVKEMEMGREKVPDSKVEDDIAIKQEAGTVLVEDSQKPITSDGQEMVKEKDSGATDLKFSGGDDMSGQTALKVEKPSDSKQDGQDKEADKVRNDEQGQKPEEQKDRPIPVTSDHDVKVETTLVKESIDHMEPPKTQQVVEQTMTEPREAKDELPKEQLQVVDQTSPGQQSTDKAAFEQESEKVQTPGDQSRQQSAAATEVPQGQQEMDQQAVKGQDIQPLADQQVTGKEPPVVTEAPKNQQVLKEQHIEHQDNQVKPGERLAATELPPGQQSVTGLSSEQQAGQPSSEPQVHQQLPTKQVDEHTHDSQPPTQAPSQIHTETAKQNVVNVDSTKTEQASGKVEQDDKQQVHESLSPSAPVAPPGYTIIDGTPFPLDMFDEPSSVDTPPIEKVQMTATVLDRAVPDIAPSKTLSNDQVTKNSGQENNQIAASKIQDVHPPIQESIAQHPSFTSRESDGLSTGETASLSDTAASVNTEVTNENKVSVETLIQSVSVSEQLFSSMGVGTSDGDKENKDSVVGEKDQQLQSDSVSKNHSHSSPEDVKPQDPLIAKDVYATSADFISRKPLSHDTNMEGNPNIAQEGQGQQQQQQQVQQQPPLTMQQENQISQMPSNQPVSGEVNEQHSSPPTIDQIGNDQATPSPVETNMEVPPPPVDKPTAVVHPWEKQETPQDSTASDSVQDSTTQESNTHPTGSRGIPVEGIVGDPAFDKDSLDSDMFNSRKINDADLEAKEDKVYQEQNSWSKTLDARLSNLIRKLPPSLQSLLEQEPLGLTPQMTVFVTMVTLVFLFLVSCCTLCFGNKKSKKKDPVLVVRGLEEQLFIMTKEKENLEDELQISQRKIKEIEGDMVAQESSAGAIETDLHNYKLHNEVLKTNIAELEQEVSELKNEVNLKKRDSHSKGDKLSDLQKQIKQKEKQLNQKTESLDKANKSLSESLAESSTLKSHLQSTTDQVNRLETRKEQLLQEIDGWNEKTQDLSERLEQAVTGQKQMQEDLAFKENELEVLRDCFLQLKAFETNEEEGDEPDSVSVQEKFKAMMDVSVVKATLRAVEEERDTTQNKLDIETQCRQDMEEQIASLQAKMETYQADKMKAERQSHEYQTKLNVLSHYFKEKEVQLQRELGEHEALKKENINRLEHADERSKMVETELLTYRSQVEELKGEILSAERDFRAQIAANEKKAHENWLAARAAERDLKESRHESSVLRQKLTDLERRLLHGPSGLIRPLPTRLGPPPGMNGPPPPLPPGVDRPGSLGGGPGSLPPGLREDDFPDSHGPERLPPPGPPMERRPPPGPMGPGGPRMPPPMMMDGRSPPPYDRRHPPPPMDRRSPPPYDRGMRMPPPPMDRRSPGYRMPPPDMIPHMRGPPPPHGLPNSPPPAMGMGPPDGRHGLGTPRYRPPPDQDPDHRPRQQSQV